jgi:phosphoglycerate-specific signal transduction histidine kinase
MAVKKEISEEELAEKEKEYELAEDVRKRMESLRQNQPEHLKNVKTIIEAFDTLDRQYDAHIQEEREFLEQLPEKVKARIEHDKAILELRKQVLEFIESVR